MNRLLVRSSGIYAIENLQNGKVYVGSAVNLYQRSSQHIQSLNRKDHHCQHLQRAFDSCGIQSFVCRILEECEMSVLIEREQFWMDSLRSCDERYGYNACPVAGSVLGRAVSEQTRAKIAAKLRGKSVSEETRAKLSAASTGRVHSDEDRAKRRLYKHTEIAKEQIRLAAVGRTHSAESIARAADKMRGRTVTDETRRKQSQSHIGNHLTEEAKKKLSLANKGKRLSPEHKAKIGAANRKHTNDDTLLRLLAAGTGSDPAGPAITDQEYLRESEVSAVKP